MAKKITSLKIEENKSGTVQVKILKHVGHYSPGQIVDVSEETAGHLTSVIAHDDGLGNITRHVRAMLLDDYQDEVEAAASDVNLTMHQAKQLGILNQAGAPADAKLQSVEADLSDVKLSTEELAALEAAAAPLVKHEEVKDEAKKDAAKSDIDEIV